MRVLSNPLAIRLLFALFVSGFACVVGVVLIRGLRRQLVGAGSLEDERPEAELFPMHAYNAVIQQLKQQKHEMATARQEERRRAKTSENISAAVLSRLPSGVLFFGVNGLVRQANAAARQILGFASLAGMSAEEIFREAAMVPAAGVPTQMMDAFYAAVHGETPTGPWQAHYVTPAGDRRILDITMASIHTPGGEALGTACLITDRTEMAEMQHQKELEGEISAEMALALRTSVATISGYARQMKNGRDLAQTERLAEDIILEATHLDHTIGGFLAGPRTKSHVVEA